MSKQNPYLIEGPALVSFSGGRTSAYMLHKIAVAHGDILPPNVIPCFANTGKERDETLRFVNLCEYYFRNRVRWVEWRDNEAGFEEVGYNSASRLGEPFAALIKKKGMPPNFQARFCTGFLKVATMSAFAKSLGWTPGNYAEVIGLRHDEGLRIFKMLERNEKDGRKCVAPLAKAKVTTRDVMAFWRQMPFDLDLEPGEGNCDLCFLKGRGLRKQIIRDQPSRADWWIEQEESVGGWFNSRDSYRSLKQEVDRQPDFFVDASDEHDVECGLQCQP